MNKTEQAHQNPRDGLFFFYYFFLLLIFGLVSVVNGNNARK
uniref:Uncharacterized protein n=1 Tax=Arundo donax TaxID=35708 RepID=A0A0A9FAP3_ARUDO